MNRAAVVQQDATTDRIERRREERVPAGFPVYYRRLRLERASREYLTSRGGSTSLGGMFLPTPHPWRPGTTLLLELFLDPQDDASPVIATAVVRWTNRWSHPRGMGIEFLDFEGLGERSLDAWLQTVRTGAEEQGNASPVLAKAS
ncbi:MAG TPA: PilZ domain-containing protein [Thermoanaerobaculia bacterium]|nr:PilZ domain-containing protein [Thermoanaerobaculia bacterium]